MLKQIIYYSCLGLVIICSFLLLSPNHNPTFNSDGAIMVLMTHNFQLPEDIYFWGQDRGGSLIPLMAQFWNKVLNISAITSVTICLYVLLAAGLSGYALLLDRKLNKVFLSVYLFLPWFFFNDMIWYTLGVQISLIGFCILLYHKLKIGESKKEFAQNVLLLLLIDLIFVINLWVSDQAIISLFALVILFYSLVFRKFKKSKMLVLTTINFLGIIAGIFVTGYLKKFALVRTENYLSINSFSQIISALENIVHSIKNYLLFNHNDVFLSISVYLVLILFVLMLISLVQNYRMIDGSKRKWILFFGFTTIASLGSLIVSNWVLQNDMGRRYFIPIYFQCFVLLFILIENSPKVKLTKFIKYYTRILALILACTNFIHFIHAEPKTLKPMVSVVADLQNLGKVGLIGSYWYSYISSVANPESIVSTPYDGDAVRNYEVAESVFSQDAIYLIKNSWFAEFPDSTFQFNHLLIKTGKAFDISDRTICEYTLAEKLK